MKEDQTIKALLVDCELFTDSQFAEEIWEDAEDDSTGPVEDTFIGMLLSAFDIRDEGVWDLYEGEMFEPVDEGEEIMLVFDTEDCIALFKEDPVDDEHEYIFIPKSDVGIKKIDDALQLLTDNEDFKEYLAVREKSGGIISC